MTYFNTKLNEGEITSLHRSRKEIEASKAKKGGVTASTWYLKGDIHRTVKCQPSPNGILAKELSKALNPVNTIERTLVVEEGGNPVWASVRRTDPFYDGNCKFGDSRCIVEHGTNCMSMGVMYEITCDQCQTPIDPENKVSKHSGKIPGTQGRVNYVGSTMTSLHNRMLSHLEGRKYKRKSSPLYRHDCDTHNEEPQTYIARIIGKDKTVFPLRLLEGLYIEAQPPGTSLNERNEN